MYDIDSKKQALKEYKNAYYIANKERLCKKSREWKLNNPDAAKVIRKRYLAKPEVQEAIKKRKIINREKINARARELKPKYKARINAQLTARRKVDILHKLRENVRARMSHAFREHKYIKTGKTHDMLGADFTVVKAHIEKTFTTDMTWENHGTYWQIDHKIPLRAATNPEQLALLCHYTNLQALSRKDNLDKRALDKYATFPENYHELRP